VNLTTKIDRDAGRERRSIRARWTCRLGRREGQGAVRPMTVVVINEDVKNMLPE